VPWGLVLWNCVYTTNREKPVIGKYLDAVYIYTIYHYIYTYMNIALCVIHTYVISFIWCNWLIYWQSTWGCWVTKIGSEAHGEFRQPKYAKVTDWTKTNDFNMDICATRISWFPYNFDTIWLVLQWYTVCILMIHVSIFLDPVEIKHGCVRYPSMIYKPICKNGHLFNVCAINIVMLLLFLLGYLSLQIYWMIQQTIANFIFCWRPNFIGSVWGPSKNKNYLLATWIQPRSDHTMIFSNWTCHKFTDIPKSYGWLFICHCIPTTQLYIPMVAKSHVLKAIPLNHQLNGTSRWLSHEILYPIILYSIKSPPNHYTLYPIILSTSITINLYTLC
jgi:hypothetical protein